MAMTATLPPRGIGGAPARRKPWLAIMPGAAPPPLEFMRADPDDVEGIVEAVPGGIGIGPHTSALRHDGVLTLLQDPAVLSAGGRTASPEASTVERKREKAAEKAEAKRVKDLEKWRSKAEKDAKAAAAKQGVAESWEDFMLEVPKQLLSEEELAKRRWLGTVRVFRRFALGLHSVWLNLSRSRVPLGEFQSGLTFGVNGAGPGFSRA
jgi:hypothetical protein